MRVSEEKKTQAAAWDELNFQEYRWKRKVCKERDLWLGKDEWKRLTSCSGQFLSNNHPSMQAAVSQQLGPAVCVPLSPAHGG